MSRKIFFALILLSFLSLGLESAPTEKRMQNTFVNRYASEECTYYAFEMRPDLPFRGNAKDWDDKARQSGYSVDKVPQVGDIIVFEPGVLGADSKNGHVAFVEAVDGNRVSLAETGWGLTKEQRQQVHRRTVTITDNLGISFIHKGPSTGNPQAQLPTQTALPQPTAIPQPTPLPQAELSGEPPDMFDALSIVRWTVQKVESGNIADLAIAFHSAPEQVNNSCMLGYSGIGCTTIHLDSSDTSDPEEFARILASAVNTQPVCLGYSLQEYTLATHFVPHREIWVFFSNMPLNEDLTGFEPQTDVAIVAFAAVEDGPFWLMELSQASPSRQEYEVANLLACP